MDAPKAAKRGGIRIVQYKEGLNESRSKTDQGGMKRFLITSSTQLHRLPVSIARAGE
jgi:hypothetical protein